MRFVRFTVPPERVTRFRDLYELRVIPALAVTQGCLSARFLQDDADPESCLSMTLWESATHAEAYADSGLYDRLLDDTDDALVDTASRRLPLSQRAPLPDPEVDSLEVRVVRGDASGPFLRVVTLNVDPGRSEEFRTRYAADVVPGLLETAGCHGLMLAESDRPAPVFLSVSFWASEQDAVRYAASGRFDQLTSAIGDLLSGIYRWRLSLSSSETTRKVEGRDLEVHGYRVLSGGALG